MGVGSWCLEGQMAKTDTKTFVLEEEVRFGFHRVCSSQVRELYKVFCLGQLQALLDIQSLILYSDLGGFVLYQ